MRGGGGSKEVIESEFNRQFFSNHLIIERKNNIWRGESEGLRWIFFLNQRRDSREYLEFERKGPVREERGKESREWVEDRTPPRRNASSSQGGK